MPLLSVGPFSLGRMTREVATEEFDPQKAGVTGWSCWGSCPEIGT